MAPGQGIQASTSATPLKRLQSRAGDGLCLAGSGSSVSATRGMGSTVDPRGSWSRDEKYLKLYKCGCVAWRPTVRPARVRGRGRAAGFTCWRTAGQLGKPPSPEAARDRREISSRSDGTIFRIPGSTVHTRPSSATSDSRARETQRLCYRTCRIAPDKLNRSVKASKYGSSLVNETLTISEVAILRFAPGWAAVGAAHPRSAAPGRAGAWRRSRTARAPAPRIDPGQTVETRAGQVAAPAPNSRHV